MKKESKNPFRGQSEIIGEEQGFGKEKANK